MLLLHLARTWEAVSGERSRLAKTALLAQLLAQLDEDEIAPGVSFCCGELPQRQIGVGWASLRDLPAPAGNERLTIGEVNRTFAEIGAFSGPGSKGLRREALVALFGAATDVEQRFLRALLVGDLRQGALTGVMVEAVAKASDVPAAAVRRAVLLHGALPAVAVSALRDGAAGLRAFRLQVGHALSPMLASTAPDIDAAFSIINPAIVEEKLDGVRVQVHRDGSEVAVFTRTLDDITSRMPEVVRAVRELTVRSIVLDGEALSVRPDGRPQPFQSTASRVGTRATSEAKLSAFYFDVLHHDGVDLLDEPAAERFAVLARVVPEPMRIRRITSSDVEIAQLFFEQALARGHEGVMIKDPAAAYAAGRRGAGWLKVKPVHTLDLVVLAVEWGYGRRERWLSNIHLGALDPVGEFVEPGGFVMLGKTFKGMTDEMLRWQTQRFKQLAVSALDEKVVHVRPAQVVEVAFDGVQASPRYPGGVALRFARVKSYRLDKAPSDVDTITTVRSFLPGE